MLEREVKLIVDEDFGLPELAGTIPGAQLRPVEQRPIGDVYHDTDDLRLARWGCTLRYRPDEGWVVKIPVPSTGRALTRTEVTFDGPPDRPDPRATALVRSLTRGARLVEVARFDTTRRVHAWTDADGRQVAELVDDAVSVTVLGAGDDRHHRWRELEVELSPGIDEASLDGLVTALTDAGARLGGTPKLIRALGQPATAPPDVVEPDLGDEPTGRDVIIAAVARATAHLVLHLPAARLGADIEGVHQARVAIRRLRSLFRTFRPLLDPDWARGVERDLGWLARDLGGVRDADVLLHRFSALIDAHPDDIDPAGGAAILDHLRRQRSQRTTVLLDWLDRNGADHLLDRLAAAAADPPTRPAADRPAADRLPRLAAKRWRRLQELVDSLDDDPPVAELHRVRILAKRARYAADAVSPAVGRPARRFAKSMAGIQDALGELNDAAVAEAWLSEFASDADGTAAFAAGRLTQLIVERARPSHAEWRDHYRIAHRPNRQGWMG